MHPVYAERDDFETEHNTTDDRQPSSREKTHDPFMIFHVLDLLEP